MLSTVKFQVARRDLGATTPFVPISGQGVQMSIDGGKLVVNGYNQLDGEYVVLVPYTGAVGTPAAVNKSNNAGLLTRAPTGMVVGMVIGLVAWVLIY
jgi:hypothetical protein